MNIPLKNVIAGVQNKSNVVLTIAHREGKEYEALTKRMTEVAGMIEILSHADSPNYPAIHWLRRYQDQLYCWRRDLHEQ